MTYPGVHNDDPEHDILYVNFNQDATCISVGTRRGHSIYKCEPFGQFLETLEGGIGIIEMLFSTSLIALVGAGDQAPTLEYKDWGWDLRPKLLNSSTGGPTQQAESKLSLPGSLTSAISPYSRVVVVLEKTVHIFDLNTLQILSTLETGPNPRGVCALSPHDENGFLAFPTGASPGEILLYDANNLHVMNAITVHKSAPACIAFSADGTLLATASETGTVIRVFSVPQGKKVATFRRGTYPCRIFCLAFNSLKTLLAVSSENGTIHVFSMVDATAEDTEEKSAVGMYLPKLMKDIVDSTRFFASARLRVSNVPVLCAIHGPTPSDPIAKLLVVTATGYFYQYSVDTVHGGDCRLEREFLLQDTKSEELGASFQTKA